MSRTLTSTSVAVPGGNLHVGMWDAENAWAPTVLAVHGVTSSHRAWDFLAQALPDARIIAPDLRGRGQSRDLVGAAGMTRHADDLAAVVAACARGPVVVVAHSMGAFVAVVFAARYPHLVQRLILVDGGLPLNAPAHLSPDELVASILGPTAARLNLRFADVPAYLDFWREHPAFAHTWSPELEDYFAYDLVAADDAEGGLRPATSYATTVEDTIDMNTTRVIEDALAALERPTTLVTVPRGLRDETPGLYPLPALDAALSEYPVISHERWDDLNHYTVVLSRAGAQRVADLVRQNLALAEGHPIPGDLTTGR